MTDRGRVSRLVDPFRDPRSRRLLGAFLSSELGDGVSAVVVPLGVYAASGSVVALAGTFLGRLVLASAFALVGGSVADRWDRRRILLGSYVVRAGAVLALLAVADSPLLFAVLGVLVGAAGAFDNPAAEASLRAVYRHDLQSLAVARKTGRTLSGLVGPALGGVLFGAGGLTAALLLNVATFVLAVVVLLPDRSPTRLPPAETQVPEEDAPPEALRAAPPVVRLAFASTLTGSFLVAFSIVVAVPYLDELADAPSGAYGYALAAYSTGAIAGLALAGLTRWTPVGTRALLVTANAAYGLLVVLSVATPRWWLLALAWLLWGLAYGPEDVVVDARVAQVVPDERMGRLYATWAVVGKVGAALAYLAAMLAAAVDQRHALLGLGAAYAAVVPLALVVLGRSRG